MFLEVSPYSISPKHLSREQKLDEVVPLIPFNFSPFEVLVHFPFGSFRTRHVMVLVTTVPGSWRLIARHKGPFINYVHIIFRVLIPLSCLQVGLIQSTELMQSPLLHFCLE